VLYAYTLCVEPKTDVSSPKKVELEIHHDTILRIGVFAPPGHFGLTGIRIKYGIKQIFPVEPTEWVTGIPWLVISDVMFRTYEKPIKLAVEMYNHDDTYEHCFYVYIDAVDWEKWAYWERMEKYLRRLAYYMYRIAKVIAPKRTSTARRSGITEAIHKIREKLKL